MNEYLLHILYNKPEISATYESCTEAAYSERLAQLQGDRFVAEIRVYRLCCALASRTVWESVSQGA